MKYARIALNKGIQRSVPSQKIPDGYMDELINLRIDDTGSMVPVGKPTKLYYYLRIDTYSKMWYHDQDGISNFMGQNESNLGLYLVNMVTGKGTLIKDYDSEISVVFVKRFMVVTYDAGMDTYLWKDGVYTLIVLPSNPVVEVGFPLIGSEYKIVETDAVAGSGSALLGKYFKAVNEQSKDGFLTGGMMVRAVFRMYDGSYILHSIPQYVEFGLSMDITEKSISGSGEENDENTIRFWVNKAILYLNTLQLSVINTNIITHICLFATRNETLYEMSEDTITDDLVLDEITGTADRKEVYNFSTVESLKDAINDNYRKMADSESWYLIHELSIADIQEGIVKPDDYKIDLKNYYQDYATRETLTVDQFSHHQLIANVAYVYNSRLILADITTKFGSYSYFPLTLAGGLLGLADSLYMPTGYTFIQNHPVKFVVTLTTGGGTIKKIIDIGSRPFGSNGTSECIVLAKSVLGYPDARAESIEVLVQQGSNWFSFGKIKLTKSKFSNYAYYTTDTFDGSRYGDPDNNYGIVYLKSDFPSSAIVNINLYSDTDYSDENRVQASEVNNPFVYPAENSYQVGTGKVLALATNTEPLSTGQFGEHPLIVFTSKGIWTLLQGSGEVLFAAVLPVNGEVPNNVYNITSVSTGVIYTTNSKIVLLIGTSVKILSTDLYGNPNTDLQAVEDFTFRINHIQLVKLVNKLSIYNARVYTESAIYGYNKEFNELVISNGKYSYSYVYSFSTGTWHKVSTSYKLFINAYPQLLGYNETDSNTGIYDLSDEIREQYIDTLFTTRPCKIDEGGNTLFTLIHRIALRCELQCSDMTYAGFYVFASNDLKTWQLFQGHDEKKGDITDLLCLRSHFKAKYFVFVFASNLKESYSFLNEIDIQYYNKLTNKIR